MGKPASSEYAIEVNDVTMIFNMASEQLNNLYRRISSMGKPASSEYAIEVNDVTMIFNMASEQLNNLKEYFIKLMKHELFFTEFRALKNISFKVKPGEVVGLVGTNGSGKSTMLTIIAGKARILRIRHRSQRRHHDLQHGVRAAQ